MNVNDLQEFLGMAVHFVYYHHSRLHSEKIFDDDYFDHLMRIGDRKYWTKMYDSLGYALGKEDYCLSIIESPMKMRYTESDIKLFFREFHSYLGKHLKNDNF